MKQRLGKGKRDMNEMCVRVCVCVSVGVKEKDEAEVEAGEEGYE